MDILDRKQLNEHYNDLFGICDLEGLVALYKPDGVRCSVLGRLLEGRDQISDRIA